MKETLSLKIKFGYASAALADSCTYTFISTFFMFFLTTIAGIDPAIAGTIAALGAIWDALLGPIVGYLSDNFKSKNGRRRPFIFVAAFPLAVATCLMFNYIDADPTFKVVYYTIMTLVFWGSFTAFFIPYLALGAEITDDYDQRTVLRSYAYIFNTFGMVVGMALPNVIVDILVNHGGSPALAWRVTGIFVAIAAFITLMITYFTTKGHNSNDDKNKNTKKEKLSVSNMVKGYWEVLKIRPLRIIICASILYLVAHTLNSADRMYFFTYNLNLTGGQITFIMLLLTVIGVFYTPFVLKFAKKYDKRRVLIFGLCFSGICITLMRYMGINDLWGLIIFSVIFSLSNTCYWQLTPAIIYDICELDELINDKRREGSIVSLQSISEAVSASISMQGLGLILKFSGFDGEASLQTENARFWTENAFSILPAIFIFLAMLLVIRYPITKDVFNNILKQVGIKRKGETPDLSDIEKIL